MEEIYISFKEISDGGVVILREITPFANLEDAKRSLQAYYEDELYYAKKQGHIIDDRMGDELPYYESHDESEYGTFSVCYVTKQTIR